MRNKITEKSSVESCKKWLAGCVGAIGIGFHPDNSFADYVSGETGKLLFSPEKAKLMDEQKAIVIRKLEAEGIDPCAYCLDSEEWKSQLPTQDEAQ